MTWDEIQELLCDNTISGQFRREPPLVLGQFRKEPPILLGQNRKESHPSVLPRQGGGACEYTSVAMYSLSIETLDPKIVWFTCCSEYLMLTEQVREGRAFILFNDVQAAPESLSGGNLVLFGNRVDWQECYVSLLEEFDTVNHIRQGILDLIALTTDNLGFHKIANNISAIFGVPVTVIDNSLSFIAVSDSITELPINNLQKEIEAGTLDSHAHELLQASEILYPRTMRPSTVCFEYHFTDESVVRNYLTLIYIKRIQVGSFSLLTTPDKTIPKCRTNLLPYIAQLLSIEMQKSDFYLMNKATYFSHILIQLLDSARLVDEDVLKKRLALFGYQLKHYKYIIYIDFKDEDLDIRQIQSFAEQFRVSIPNSIYMIHEKNILYLKSSNDLVISEEEISDWLKIIAQTKLKIGISSTFEDIFQARSHLKQARSVINTGRAYQATTPVYSFDAYRLADIVAHMPDDVDYYYYCYPPMRRLIERDTANGTNLAYTLYKYLENPGNPAEVCKELFVHKNTLYYRMDKIREIMQTDLKKAEVIAQIQLTFQILKFKNRFASLIERKPD